MNPGYVRLFCDDPPLDLTTLLGDTAPKITGGFGGWEVTGRPQQIGMTTWQGTDPLGLELSLMLDGFATNTSVEPPLRAILAVARGDDESPSGIVRLQGLPMPIENRAGLPWVIENIDFGDPILRPDDGHRIRQPLTLTLREFVPPTYLQLRKSALKGSKGKTKVITAKKGDTPAGLARRQRCAWTEIRELNLTATRPRPPWKANTALPVGTKVRVPVATSDTRSRTAKGSTRSRKAATSRRSN
jgi:hypothetical protein